MARQLIVNADDYGRSPGVSKGILEAHRKGIVTSTSVMINQPGVADQLEAAQRHSTLGIGLHFVFTAWRPILPPEDVPGLVDKQGHFLDQHSVWARAEEIPVEQLRAELSAQLQRFVSLASGPPDHLDCHHFVHLHPSLFEVYVNLAADWALPLRVPFPRQTEFRRAVATLPFLEGFPHELVQGMISENSALLQSQDLVYPEHFCGSFFGSESLTLNGLCALLHLLPEGTSELMCHPGYNDGPLVRSSYRAEREIELSLLSHPRVAQTVNDADIQLIVFGDLK